MINLFYKLFFLITGIAGIGFLIIFHEFGHFLFSKLFGMRVPTFSIGFGPKLVTKKMGETEFTISAIPLGGYVDLGTPEGMADDERAFIKRPYYQKFLVILGGIGFNMLFAYLAFVCLFFFGMPETRFLYPENAVMVVEAIEKDSPIEKAGLLPQDTIKAINGKFIAKPAEFHEQIKKMADQQAVISIERNGTPHDITTTVGTKSALGQTFGYVGVMFKMTPLAQLPFTQAVSRGIALTNQFIGSTVDAFKNLIVSRNTSEIAGPLMLFSGSVQFASKGLKVFLIFLAIISVNLAIMNLIPLPVFDGGRLMLYTIEAIIGRPLPEKAQEYIFMGTWLALIALTLYMVKQDIVRMFWSK